MTDLTRPTIPACAMQEEACHRLMAQLGLSDRGPLSDRGVSERTFTNRPVLAKILEGARAGDLRVIVTTSLDRLARNMVDLHAFITQIERHAIELVTVEEGLIAASTLTSLTPSQAEAVRRGSRPRRDRQGEVQG